MINAVINFWIDGLCADANAVATKSMIPFVASVLSSIPIEVALVFISSINCDVIVLMCHHPLLNDWRRFAY
ncbi:hypothetical protein [Staphylococcus shinii]